MATPKQGYRAADGLKIPSVTTILGRFKESGALIRWAYNRGVEGVPLYESRDAAADVGTFVHSLIEAFLSTGEIDIPAPDGMTAENQEKAASAFAAFRSWLEGSRLKVTPLEKHFVSEAHRFGGTPDAIAQEPDGSLSLLDWKTSKTFYPDQLVQVAAYRQLWNETHPAQPMTGGVHIVRFGKDGGDFSHNFFPPTHRKLAAAWAQFLCFRQAYDLDKVVTGKDE
jgi:hypothetical protein